MRRYLLVTLIGVALLTFAYSACVYAIAQLATRVP